MKKKQILVIGASGFIGKNLIPRLLKQGHGVTVVGRRKHKDFNKPIRFIQADLVKPVRLKNILAQIDCIIHLAADTNVNASILEPARVLKYNSDTTLNLLEQCRLAKVQPLVIFASTDRMYGRTRKRSVSETDPVFPLEPYTASKILGEILVQTYQSKYGIPYVILRLDSVYGPNQPSQMFISDMIHKMSSGSDISVGNLSVKKNFVYVDDVADAFILAVSARPSAYNSVYNIGGKQVSLEQIFKILKRLAEKRFQHDISVRFQAALVRQSGIEISPFRLSTIRAQKQLGWKQQISLAEGLKLTFDHFFIA